MVAQDLPNLGHGRARPDQPGPEGMAQDVRTPVRRMQVRALKGFAYDAADGSSSAKAPDGRAESEEQAARRGLRTIFDHVTRQGLPDLGQQGEVIDDIPLPLDDDLS
jgi:hypothetical protein